jgi:hypothetical protein
MCSADECFRIYTRRISAYESKRTRANQRLSPVLIWLRGQVWAQNLACLHLVIGRARIPSNTHLPVWKMRLCALHFFFFLCTGATDCKTKNACYRQVLIGKWELNSSNVRVLQLTGMLRERGKLFMLAEAVNISINALYLYRADQVVNVLNNWAGCIYFLMISNNKAICLPYQIIW